MELEDQFKFGHLLLDERVCRACGVEKNLIDGFYRTRKDRGATASSYSYECKECAIKRVSRIRKEKNNKPDIPYNPVPRINDVYPDW